MMDRTTGKGIVIGLVSGTLLAYVVRPVLDHLPSVTLRVAGTLSQTYTDSIYRTAAQPYPPDTSPFTTLAVICALTAAWFADPTLSSMRRQWRLFFVGFLLVLALLSFFANSVSGANLALQQCFHSRLAVLSPHVSERESKELVAAWTMMRNQSDFRAINTRFADYASKFNVSPLLKSLEGTHQGRCI